MKWPVMFSIGFRPWFLVLLGTGSLLLGGWGVSWFAAATATNMNFVLLPSLLDWRWHAHEMIFGLGIALLAGFLLTAVQNWTGRRPLSPAWLFVSVLVWLITRVVYLLGGVHIPLAYVLSAMPAFMVGMAILRVIAMTRQWHNLIFPVSLILLAVLDVYFGAQIDSGDLLGHVAILGLWPVLGIVLFIAQRILPAFTAGRAGIRPRSMGNTGAVIFSAGPVLLLLLNVLPQFQGQNTLLGVTAVIIVLSGLWSVWRWWHPIVLREPMLLIIYSGFVLTLTGLALMGIFWLLFATGNTGPFWLDAGVHGVGIGILGVMGPGMLLRVSAGHTGRPIVMPVWLRWFFVAAVGIWLMRVVAPWFGYNPWLLFASAWGLAAVYLALLFGIAGWLIKPRVDGHH
ncbi:MAG: NnrS family protein [Halothiobacillus sp.]